MCSRFLVMYIVIYGYNFGNLRFSVKYIIYYIDHCRLYMLLHNNFYRWWQTHSSGCYMEVPRIMYTYISTCIVLDFLSIFTTDTFDAGNRRYESKNIHVGILTVSCLTEFRLRTHHAIYCVHIMSSVIRLIYGGSTTTWV